MLFKFNFESIARGDITKLSSFGLRNIEKNPLRGAINERTLYTYRMGASDNIHSGKSTFMVELMVCVLAYYFSVCTHLAFPKLSCVAWTSVVKTC